MMKKWITMVIILLAFLSMSGQQILSKFNVTEVTLNKEDLSEQIENQNLCTVLYTEKNEGKLCMANIAISNRTQSFGYVYDYKAEEKKTETGERKTVINFKWDYTNTYNNKTGTVDVIFTKIYKPKGNVFMMIMILKNKDVYVYKGVEVPPEL